MLEVNKGGNNMEAIVSVFSEVKTSVMEQLGISTLSNFVPALIFLLIALIATKIILRVVRKMISNFEIEKSLHTFIMSIAKFLLYAVTLIIVLGILGIPITSLVAVLSILGLAFSLAVQGSLSNLAGGVTILATKPFKVGDFTEIGDVSGTVVEIGLFYTKLCTADKKDIFIPNATVSGSTIINYSSEPNRKLVLKFTASYDDSVEKVKAALNEVVSGDNRILKDPEPFINVSAYLDSSIEYMVAVWVKNEDYWPVNWAIIEDVKRSFDKNGVTMSYNHINVHMMDK